jgi:hypothetical protein
VASGAAILAPTRTYSPGFRAPRPEQADPDTVAAIVAALTAYMAGGGYL